MKLYAQPDPRLPQTGKDFGKLGNTPMKYFVMMGAVAATLLTALAAEGRPVRVYEQWCLNVTEGLGGGVYRCQYATYYQCMASRTANGDWCMRNPALGGEDAPGYYYR
jgi:Protein of unknown function (DUF3551)